tara:strand:+ start:414 stop:557 length:144 start_codon:yes stop_codon:yes gene_type:complete
MIVFILLITAILNYQIAQHAYIIIPSGKSEWYPARAASWRTLLNTLY